jgi:hypothetical protein
MLNEESFAGDYQFQFSISSVAISGCISSGQHPLASRAQCVDDVSDFDARAAARRDARGFNNACEHGSD